MNNLISLTGRIVNDNGYCSDECTWMVEFELSVPIPIFQNGKFCTLYRAMLDTDIRTGKTAICEMCKAQEEEGCQ